MPGGSRSPLRLRSRSSAELPSSTVYDENYFLSDACEGWSDYSAGTVSAVKDKELALLGLQAGQRVLDLGCGRGEVSAEINRRGAVATSIDYSADAVRLSKTTIGAGAQVVRGDAAGLPFPDGSFDRILLGDVIEHLPWPVAVRAMGEVQRVLAPGGRALIHTSPNAWFIAFVKPPLLVAMRGLRRHEVLVRFEEYDRLRGVLHPNELSPRSFVRLLREAGTPGEVWVDRDVLRSGASAWTSSLPSSRLMRLAASVAGAWPARLLLGNDLYATVVKPAAADWRKSSKPLQKG